MHYTISNGALSVQIRDLGAELWSIRSWDGAEYLWQGDEAYWGHRAWNLFPFVGLCWDNTYLHQGRAYRMEEHGFLKDTVLQVVEREETSIRFACADTEATRRVYPFRFSYGIAYSLAGNRLQAEVCVRNTGSAPLYYAVGWHPGFRVPLEAGLDYEDYELQFPAEARPGAAPCTCRPCYLQGPFAPYPLTAQRLPLRHRLFAEHMLILDGTGGSVTLRAPGGRRQITVEYPDAEFLGIWKCIGSRAPYVCLEPWSGLPDAVGGCREISRRDDMKRLPPGGAGRHRWSVTVTV